MPVYVDLSLNGTDPLRDGTVAKPFGWDDCQDVDPGDNSSILLKGSRSVTTLDHFFYNQFRSATTIDKWGDDSWRLQATDPTSKDFGKNVWFVNNGIIDIIGQSGQEWLFGGGFNNTRTNLIVIYHGVGSALSMTSNQNNTLTKGCTFIIPDPTSIFRTGIGLATITDCVVHSSSIDQHDGRFSLTANKCVFTSTDPDPSQTWFSKTQCQFGWTPPTWPAWNSPKEDWAVALLSVGITTPPEPGTSPYTGYETDPWGNTRTGIGAFYMGSVTPEPTTVKLSATGVFFVDTDGALKVKRIYISDGTTTITIP